MMICKNKKIVLSTVLEITLLSFISIILIIGIKQKPSVWSDEYLAGVDYLHIKDFFTFYRYVLSYGPTCAPVFFFVFHLFCAKWGFTVEEFRWILVCFSLITINITYFFCRCFLSKKYAFMATLFFALSPIYLWYSPLLRYHVINHMLSMVSLYIYFRYIYIPEEKHTILPSLVLMGVNILLFLTHYIFIWVIALEIVLSIAQLLKERRAHFSVLLGNFILFVTGFLYLRYIFKYNKFLSISFTAPFLKIFEMVFGIRDFEVPTYASWSIYIQPLIFPRNIPSWMQKFLDTTPQFILNTYGISIALILFLFATYLFLTNIGNIFGIEGKLLALVVSAFGFPALFAIYSIYTGTDILVARYLMPTLVAKLCLLFFILERWKTKALIKRAIIGLLILSSVHQYLIFRISMPYTDWDGCIQNIEKDIKENDIVICCRDVDTAVFKYNWKEKTGKESPCLFTVTNLQTTADFIVYIIKNLPPEQKIYVIFNMQWNHQIEPIVTGIWERLGLCFELKNFPSWEGLLCYSFPVDKNVSNPCLEKVGINEKKYNVEIDILSLLNIQPNTELSEIENLILKRYEFLGEDVGLVTPVHITWDLLSLGEKHWAQSITQHFQLLNSWMTFGNVLANEDDCIRASKEFEIAKKQNTSFALVFQPIWNAIRDKDYLILKKETEHLIDDGYFPAYLFFHFAKHKVNNEQCPLPLGVYPFTKESEDKLLSLRQKEQNKTTNPLLEERYSEVMRIIDYRISLAHAESK